MLKVLLVEPDRHFSDLLQGALEDRAELAVVRSAQEAIDWLDQPKRKCDMVISEIALGAHSGVEIIHELRSHFDWLNLPILIHSRIRRPKELSRERLRLDYGVIDYIQKGQGSIEKIRDQLSALVAV